MANIHEQIDIAAPLERVWAVVAEDVKNAPRWTTYLDKVEKLDDGPPGRGTRYRYHLNLPGGNKVTLEVEQDVYNKPKKCAGRFIKGPLKGTWSYTYTQRKDGTTRLVYDMDYGLTGLLRFAGGLLGPQYAAGIHKNMESLQRYIESGKGPKPKQ
ncbi:MAG TPA: SRPBCC family protein [Candidatus Limnocylindrales bacterium]|nr:SRPBCC family protein [Candidatus Limnocylindrales bacterium]